MYPNTIAEIAPPICAEVFMMPDTVPAWLRPISMHVANAVAWLSPMATNESVNAASVVSLAFAITASVIPTAQCPTRSCPPTAAPSSARDA